METQIAGVKLTNPVCNASGPRDTTFEELQYIAHTESSVIVMKSCTINPREGNPEPRYKKTEYGSIQAMGLPNLGYHEYIKYAHILRAYDKPIMASVAGINIEDYAIIVQSFQSNNDVDLIEINLSCPNAGKSIIGYDLASMEEVLKQISKLGCIPIGLKLPAYYDDRYFEKVTDLVLKYNISFISCINSIGNTLCIDIDTESPVISPQEGFGGLSGHYIKPVAIANVRRFYRLLQGRVSIFGVGGVSSGKDVFEYILMGADAVQIGTAFQEEGEYAFQRILFEFEFILKKKGYKTIADFKGNLKYQ